MSTPASHRHGKRARARVLALRRRAAAWQRQLRLAAALATVGLGLAATPASAQMGQAAMAPAGGVVNRAVQGLASLNQNGEGILYYGINAADRGLGYQGSYMTLGGFIPGFEDDLGGFWSADLRGHLSVYGGFFSNVGAVRKQFIGGSLLGIGVYWDYDGDLNQYADTPIEGTSYVFAGGQVYNQVGISGEWLTDFGALRSNGYIPVGSTGQSVGPFVGNSILCVNGVNAGLGGADLETGLYIPGLSDWAGMISVGGYAYGNARYTFPNGQDLVPWFGGVYTRLDLTLVQNWDFSLQYNNDSYFDSTGFARLTYRMGGSRRRNVPDQMEQPMMRNEHIVRAHQTPEVAINPETGTPWRVIHADNTAAGPGDGTAESPFPTVGQASTAAVSAYDIVYVHVGTSASGTPYVTPASGFQFNAPNQYLIGEGSSLAIPTLDCGSLSLLATTSTSVYPVLVNPLGAAVVVNQPGATVNHLQITGSPVGISDGSGFVAPGVSTVSDVIISGNGPFQRGVEIANSTGQFVFDNVRLENMTNDGFVVSADGGDVAITNSSIAGTNGTGTTGTAILVSGSGANVRVSATKITDTVGTGVNAAGATSSVALTSVTIDATTGDAVVASGSGAQVTVASSTITNTSDSAIVASGIAAGVTASDSIIRTTGNPAILVSGSAAAATLYRTRVSDVEGVGALVSGPGSVFTMADASRLQNVSGDGIQLTGVDAFVSVSGRSIISQIDGDGINTAGGSVQLANSSIQTVGGAAIAGSDVIGTNCVWVQGATITNATDGGIVLLNSNLRVERLDVTNPTSVQTTITNTGIVGISVTSDENVFSRVLVDSTAISGVNTGILIAADADLVTFTRPQIDFTATNNQITTNGNGTGIAISGVFDGQGGYPGVALSRVQADMEDNRINPGTGGDGILLTTVGGPAQFVDANGNVIVVPPASKPLWVSANSQANLSNLNNGTVVTEEPAPGANVVTSVNYNPAVTPAQPPASPAPPP